MNKFYTLFLNALLASIFAIFSSVATANDAKLHQGKQLHDQKCTNCHQSEVYSRDDRMVKTMSALEHQVNNCMKGAAKAEWTRAQTTSVVDFLNDRYYKF